MQFYRDYSYIIKKEKNEFFDFCLFHYKQMIFTYRYLAKFLEDFYLHAQKVITIDEFNFLFEQVAERFPITKKMHPYFWNALKKKFMSDYFDMAKKNNFLFSSMFFSPNSFIIFNNSEFEIDFHKKIIYILDNAISLPDDISNLFDKKIGKVSFSVKNEKLFIIFHCSFSNSVVSVSNLKSFDSLNFVGIDLGLKDFLILSNGEHVSNPRFLNRYEEKIKELQRILSSCQPQSNNWFKTKKKINNLHRKIINSRRDFFHQLSRKIVDDFDVICLENLDIKSLSSKKRKSHTVLDASWGIFLKMLHYKAEEKGKLIIQIDRFFPSSKKCSQCGSITQLDLSVREYSCATCGFSLDRDLNAAINIMNEGKRIYFEGFIKHN